MSALRSVIEEVTTTDLNRYSDGDLTEEAIEVSRAIDVLTHRLAEIAENARSRGCFRQAGYLNVTRWLADVTDLDDATARGLVALGGTLSAHSDTRRLSSQGDLSRARLRVLSRAGKAHPTHFDRDEEMLLDFASTLTMSDFKKAVAYWSNCADAERAEIEAAEQCDSARLHASKTFGGMVALDGSFDPEGGEIILQALDAAMTPEARRDGASGDCVPPRDDAPMPWCRYVASTWIPIPVWWAAIVLMPP
jgi:hypothetical protein